MKKAKISLYVNILSFFVFLVSAVTGFVLWFVLPSGLGNSTGRGAVDLFFLGFTRHNWKDIHKYFNLTFIVLMLIHFILHLNYIKNIFKLIKNK
ncbi:DUF4405 domain-containing protein [Patescibacteria group bacterium]